MIPPRSPRWVEALRPGPLVYVSTILGRHYSTQWTRYAGRDGDGLHTIECLVAIDPTAIGLGGTPRCRRSQLWCTDALDPVRVTLEAGGGTATLRFGADAIEATLADGSIQTVPRTGARYVVDGDLPGLSALLFVEESRLGRLPALDLVVCLVGTIAVIPYRSAPAADLAAGPGSEAGAWHRTSHDEEILLDAHGLMRKARLPKLGLVCTLDRTSPLPAWSDGPAPVTPPLTYARPEGARFRLENLVIAGPATTIGASLSIPPGDGPFPGVLFVGGSGTHDRHGIAGEIDIGTHEIMDALAERGIAGLRFDTRGAGSTALGDDALDHGLAADTADVRACLAALRACPEVAGRPLAIIGHSQGGTIALALAAEGMVPVAAIALMAAPGRAIDAIIADQIIANGATLGFAPEQIARQLADLREAVGLVRSGRPWVAGTVPDALLAMFRTPTWLRDMLRHDPLDLVGRVPCPVLVCQGAADIQISPKHDAEALVAAARAAGVPCTQVSFEGLDHLFKRTRGPSTIAEYHEVRPVDPGFIALLGDWLTQRLR